jgi:hypothetical protein
LDFCLEISADNRECNRCLQRDFRRGKNVPFLDTPNKHIPIRSYDLRRSKRL